MAPALHSHPIDLMVTQHLTSYIKRSRAWQYLAAVSLAYSGYTIPAIKARCYLSIDEWLLGHVYPKQVEKARLGMRIRILLSYAALIMTNSTWKNPVEYSALPLWLRFVDYHPDA